MMNDDSVVVPQQREVVTAISSKRVWALVAFVVTGLPALLNTLPCLHGGVFAFERDGLLIINFVVAGLAILLGINPGTSARQVTMHK
jgi:hypothetical protein